MAFAAIFVPNFILQALVRLEPELRSQPIAVIEAQPPLYRVIALNQQAESLGVAAGMTKGATEQFTEVKIRPRSRTKEETAHMALLDAAWSISSRVENFAPDTLLLDISGLARLFGAHEQIASRIASCTSELGIGVHIAISENLETARIVARSLPGPTVVPKGEERRFLETLPVRALSPSQQLAEILEQWGVTSCKSLASLPVASLSECVGQEGVRLHALAGGKGNRPLLITEATHCFEEIFELDDGVDNLEPLSFLLGRLLQQLCVRISARALAIGAVHVNFQMQPAFESALDLRSKAAGEMQSLTKLSCSMKLPVPSIDPKLLLSLLRLRLQSQPPPAPVHKIHMIAEPARTRVTQSGLFAPASPDPQKLELTTARLAAIVGESNVGSPELLDTCRPDSFHMQKLSLASDTAAVSEQTEPPMGFRVCRPPLLAHVELQGKSPACVSFQGMRGNVIRASGPWRTSGDWWEDQPWQEDAWDLEIHFPSASPPLQGLYRVSFDPRNGKWFVRGVYD